jgi:hypothetical protein
MKKNDYLLLICLGFLSLAAHAQKYTSVVVPTPPPPPGLSRPNPDIYCQKSAYVMDGAVIDNLNYSVGFTENTQKIRIKSPSNGDSIPSSKARAHIICTDLSGTEIFNNTYRFGNNDIAMRGSAYYSICDYNEGMVAVTGNVSSGMNLSSDKNDLILFSLVDKATGIPVLTKAIGIPDRTGSYPYSSSLGKRIFFDGNDFFITGSSIDADSTERLFVLKIAQDGAVYWCNSFDPYINMNPAVTGYERNTCGNDILVHNQKIYVVGQTSGIPGSGAIYGPQEIAFLAEIDTTGALLNFIIYSIHGHTSNFKSLKYNSITDQFVACGYGYQGSAKYPLFITIDPMSLQTQSHVLYDLDPNNTPPNEKSEFTDLTISYDNTYLVTGTHNISTTFGTDNYNIVALKLDDQGAIIDAKEFNDTLYGEDDFGVSINEVPDLGNYGTLGTHLNANSYSIPLHPDWVWPEGEYDAYCPGGIRQVNFQTMNFNFCESDRLDVLTGSWQIHEDPHYCFPTFDYSEFHLGDSLREEGYYMICDPENDFQKQKPSLQNNKINISDEHVNIAFTGNNYYHEIKIDASAKDDRLFFYNLYDISGKKILSGENINGLSGKMNIDISNLNHGVYIFVVYRGDEVVSYNKLIY